MQAFGLYTKFIAQDGQRDALAKLLLEAASGMDTVEGCELYLVNLQDDDPNGVWVTELWTDAAAHQASLALEQAQALIGQARPLIAGVMQIKLQPVGGKGMRRA